MEKLNFVQILGRHRVSQYLSSLSSPCILSVYSSTMLLDSWCVCGGGGAETERDIDTEKDRDRETDGLFRTKDSIVNYSPYINEL